MDRKDRFCRSRSKLDPISHDLKMATVTRLPAKKTHQKKLLHRVESGACSRGAMKRKEPDRDEDDEKDTPPSMLDSLHLDLKLVTLSSLPAKSLTKLRCVSKMWSSIIRSREFVDSYYAMSSTKSRFIVALSNGIDGEPEEELTFFFSFSHEGEESSSLVPNYEMAIPTGLCHREYFASLHGFLIVKTDCGLMLCNPSTEQAIKLPERAAFVGYDPIGDQYKALILHSGPSGNPPKHKVLTLGGTQGWRHIECKPITYVTYVGVCINGVLYYGGHTQYEKLSFIPAPKDVVQWGKESIYIDYNEKLASIVRNPYFQLRSFDLWILEDVGKNDWSKQTCVLPQSMWVSPSGYSFPGATKPGEIIMLPNKLSREVQSFYIFYYNVETKNVRRVRLLGIGDDKKFRRSYGFAKRIDCYVRMVPQHVESSAFLKNPIYDVT